MYVRICNLLTYVPHNYRTSDLRQRVNSTIHQAPPCMQVDHIVELQVVARALNNINHTHVDPSLQILINFFNSQSNLQFIPAKDNEAKRSAVNRYLSGCPTGDDLICIKIIKARWTYLKPLLANFELFKREMDKILA